MSDGGALVARYADYDDEFGHGWRFFFFFFVVGLCGGGFGEGAEMRLI